MKTYVQMHENSDLIFLCQNLLLRLLLKGFVVTRDTEIGFRARVSIGAYISIQSNSIYCCLALEIDARSVRGGDFCKDARSLIQLTTRSSVPTYKNKEWKVIFVFTQHPGWYGRSNNLFQVKETTEKNIELLMIIDNVTSTK